MRAASTCPIGPRFIQRFRDAMQSVANDRGAVMEFQAGPPRESPGRIDHLQIGVNHHLQGFVRHPRGRRERPEAQKRAPTRRAAGAMEINPGFQRAAAGGFLPALPGTQAFRANRTRGITRAAALLTELQDEFSLTRAFPKRLTERIRPGERFGLKAGNVFRSPHGKRSMSGFASSGQKAV